MNDKTLQNLANRRSEQYLKSVKSENSMRNLQQNLSSDNYRRLLSVIQKDNLSPDSVRALFAYVHTRDYNKFFNKYCDVFVLMAALLRSNRRNVIVRFMETRYGKNRNRAVLIDDSAYEDFL